MEFSIFLHCEEHCLINSLIAFHLYQTAKVGHVVDLYLVLVDEVAGLRFGETKVQDSVVI